MARTVLTVTDLVRGGAVSTATAYAAADAENGMSVATSEPEKIVLHVKNGGASPIDVTVRAGAYGRAGLGDATYTVAAGGESAIMPYESMRFEQADESLYVDFSAATSVTIAAFRIP